METNLRILNESQQESEARKEREEAHLAQWRKEVAQRLAERS